MRPVTLAAGALLLGCAGCAWTTAPHPARYDLPHDDVAFSQALAHYAEGLMLEADEGRGPTAALDAFRQAAALDPSSPGLAHRVAALCLQQDDVDGALAALERLVKAQPGLDSHLTLARVAEDVSRPALAATHYRAASRFAPATTALRYDFVRCAFAGHDDRAALRELRALSRSPDGRPDPAPAYTWALAFVRDHQAPGRALACLAVSERATTNDAQRAEIADLAGVAHLRLGDTNAAIRTFTRAARLTPDDLDRAFRLARLERECDGPAVTNTWQRRSARDPRDPLPRLALAREAADRRDWTAALAWSRKAGPLIARASGSTPGASWQAFVAAALDESGRDDEAEAALLAALKLHPGDPTLQNHLAYLWAERNVHLDEAETLVRQALRSEPANGAFLDTLGWVRYRQRQFNDALSLLLQALRQIGDDAVVLDHVGDVLSALGRNPEAQAFWRRALAVDPSTPGLQGKVNREQ